MPFPRTGCMKGKERRAEGKGICLFLAGHLFALEGETVGHKAKVAFPDTPRAAETAWPQWAQHLLHVTKQLPAVHQLSLCMRKWPQGKVIPRSHLPSVLRVTSTVTRGDLVSGSRSQRCHPASPTMSSCPWDQHTCAALTQGLVVWAMQRAHDDPENPSADELRGQVVWMQKNILKCCLRSASQNCRDLAPEVLDLLHPWCAYGTSAWCSDASGWISSTGGEQLVTSCWHSC